MRSRLFLLPFLALSSLSKIEFAPTLADGVFHPTLFVALSSLSLDRSSVNTEDKDSLISLISGGV
jgi:hypothetical protein